MMGIHVITLWYFFFWFAFEHGHLKVDLPTYGKSADFS